jgi:hypothetical protein
MNSKTTDFFTPAADELQFTIHKAIPPFALPDFLFEVFLQVEQLYGLMAPVHRLISPRGQGSQNRLYA